jgi:hypothetical protein
MAATAQQNANEFNAMTCALPLAVGGLLDIRVNVAYFNANHDPNLLTGDAGYSHYLSTQGKVRKAHFVARYWRSAMRRMQMSRAVEMCYSRGWADFLPTRSTSIITSSSYYVTTRPVWCVYPIAHKSKKC